MKLHTKRRVSAVASVCLSAAILWPSIGRPATQWGVVENIANYEFNSLTVMCLTADPEYPWPCVQYGLMMLASYWGGVASDETARGAYCTQYLIWPCTDTYYGQTMHAIDWGDTADALSNFYAYWSC
jgi:hypothetical protein